MRRNFLYFQNLDGDDFVETRPTPDLFLSAVGYESRSTHLLDLVAERGEVKKGICFFSDYSSYSISNEVFNKCADGWANYAIGQRADYPQISQNIFSWIDSIIVKDRRSECIVDIDYSSMPRAWYCQLVIDLALKYDKKYLFRFWYSEGEYSNSHPEGFPTAGIDQFLVFSGRGSIDSLKNRVHLVGIGFDSIRTAGIRAVLDPSYLVACFAYNSDTPKVLDRIRNENSMFLDGCAQYVGLPVSDFTFMMARLVEYVRNMSTLGDLIIVPDGPKPLVLAMSLLPWQLSGLPISCFHVTGAVNTAVDIKPTGKVFGFSFHGIAGSE